MTKKVFEVNWNAEAAEKGGYEHFMLKEINEQPKAVRDTMSQRIAKDGKSIVMNELKWDADYLNSFNKIYIVACGTAYHAGLVGKFYIEKLARVMVEVDVASEFRYRNPIVDENTLFIVVSQSGETSDTLAALKESKRLGAKTLALTNVVGSSIAREADQVLYTWAGPEIAVASTKAYTTQLILFFMLALYMRRSRRRRRRSASRSSSRSSRMYRHRSARSSQMSIRSRRSRRSTASMRTSSTSAVCSTTMSLSRVR